jgi:indolepyruvate decarboxylase
VQAKNPTVAEYAISRIADLGIRHVFGLPGDFAFPVDDAITADPRLTWVVSSNELNAAYSADGYARTFGAAMLTTTYAVGELSAINGVMGSKAEHLPVFHIAGAPPARSTRAGLPLHHSMGDGVTGQFFELSAASACVSAKLDPMNAIVEMERVVATAVRNRQPAFIQIPMDYAHMEVVGTPIKGAPLSEIQPIQSDPEEMKVALAAVSKRVAEAKRPVILAAFRLARYGLSDELVRLLDATGIPFATTGIDKGVGPEGHPGFLGMYKGAGSQESVIRAVEEADLVLNLGGALFDDLSTSFNTAHISRDALVTINPDSVIMTHHGDELQAATRSYGPVWIKDVMKALIDMGKHTSAASPPDPAPAPAPATNGTGGLTYAVTTSHIEKFLTPSDVFMVETGTSSFYMTNVRLPSGCKWHNQTLWGSIGWATPATFGAAMGAPDQRVILVTGDGAHQLTATEIGVMGRYKVNPIIVVINNGWFGVEEYLDRNAHCEYNMLAQWNYSKIPEAMGCSEWLCLRVETESEFAEALSKARNHTSGVYIEAVLAEPLLPALSSDGLARAYHNKPMPEDA